MDNKLKNNLQELRKIMMMINTQLCDIFRDNVQKRISEIDTLRDCCKIMQCDKNSITLKINDIPFHFINGEFMDMDVDDDMTSIPFNDNNIFTLLGKKTQSVQEQMPMSIDPSFTDNMECSDLSMDNNIMVKIISEIIMGEIDILSKELISLLQRILDPNVSYESCYPHLMQSFTEMKDDIMYYIQNFMSYSDLKDAMEIDYKNASYDQKEDIFIQDDLMIF